MMNYKRHAMMKAAATTTMMVTEINLTEWGPLLLIRGHACTMFNFGRRGRGGCLRQDKKRGCTKGSRGQMIFKLPWVGDKDPPEVICRSTPRVGTDS